MLHTWTVTGLLQAASRTGKQRAVTWTGDEASADYGSDSLQVSFLTTLFLPVQFKQSRRLPYEQCIRGSIWSLIIDNVNTKNIQLCAFK